MLSIDRAAVALAITLGVTACGDVSSRDVTCGSKPVEVLPNGGFDAAAPPWTQDPATASLICDKSVLTPADGTAAACIGKTDGKTQTLTQEVSLPAGAKSARLSGKICIDTAETMAVEHDTLSFDLLDGDTVIAAIGKASNLMGSKGCMFGDFERMATVTSDPPKATLRIRSTLDTAMPTTFYLDALSLTIGCTQ